MLPGQLDQQYANDPRYQSYKQWVAQGGKANWWTQDAQKAARDAGVSYYRPDYDQKTWQHVNYDWGESADINPATGQAEGIINPQWYAFIKNYMSQHPGEPAGQTPAPTGGSQQPEDQSAAAAAPTNQAPPPPTTGGYDPAMQFTADPRSNVRHVLAQIGKLGGMGGGQPAYDPAQAWNIIARRMYGM